jgi:hypothetical protein
MKGATLRSVLGGIAVLALGGFAVAASGQRPALGMLDQLEPGRWELRLRDAPGVERLCMHDGRRLIQLRHPQEQCERFIVNDDPDDVTIQYTCRGRGYGRTHIRRESGRIVHIETQGIAEGLPFNYAAEARRVGDCAS